LKQKKGLNPVKHLNLNMQQTVIRCGKFEWKKGSHSQKNKNLIIIDSVQVPWGKGEKQLIMEHEIVF